MPSSSADQSDACQLKAGHPPAVKVGNMRVTQRTHSTSSTHSDKGDEVEKNETVPSACSFAPKTVIKSANDGVLENTPQSVPEAVKQFHEKPQASHEYRSQSGRPNHIQQPKK